MCKHLLSKMSFDNAQVWGLIEQGLAPVFSALPWSPSTVCACACTCASSGLWAAILFLLSPLKATSQDVILFFCFFCVAGVLLFSFMTYTQAWACGPSCFFSRGPG